MPFNEKCGIKKADGAPPQNGGQGMTEADDHVHPSDDSSLRT